MQKLGAPRICHIQKEKFLEISAGHDKKNYIGSYKRTFDHTLDITQWLMKRLIWNNYNFLNTY